MMGRYRGKVFRLQEEDVVHFWFEEEEIHLGLERGKNTSDDGCKKIGADLSDKVL